jgi:hypothetical protein
MEVNYIDVMTGRSLTEEKTGNCEKEQKSKSHRGFLSQQGRKKPRGR